MVNPKAGQPFSKLLNYYQMKKLHAGEYMPASKLIPLSKLVFQGHAYPPGQSYPDALGSSAGYITFVCEVFDTQLEGGSDFFSSQGMDGANMQLGPKLLQYLLTSGKLTMAKT